MGETYIGLVRNIPTRVPSALVVRTHLADLVYTLLCSHLRLSLADVSCFHMKIFGGGAFLVQICYLYFEFTRLTLCVRSCIKLERQSGVLSLLVWPELVKMLQNISYESNLFAMYYLSIQARFDVFGVTNIFSGNFTNSYPTFK